MLRQFFLSIPAELDEAAMLDGCGRLRVLWHILLPEIKPALIVVGMFTFLGQWNDFFGPLIYLTKTSSTPWLSISRSGLRRSSPLAPDISHSLLTA